jgi:hypothetical protein
MEETSESTSPARNSVAEHQPTEHPAEDRVTTMSRLKSFGRHPVSHIVERSRSQSGRSSEQQDKRGHIANLPLRFLSVLAHAFSKSYKKQGRAVHIEMSPIQSPPASATPSTGENSEVAGRVTMVSRTPSGDVLGFHMLSRTPSATVREMQFVHSNE